MLSIRSALAYLVARQPDAVFFSAYQGAIDGFAVVEIAFHYADGTPGSGTFWIENGKLYGEW